MFRWGDEARRDFVREHVMTGRHRLAVGFGEPNSGFDTAALRTTAEDHGAPFLVPQTVGVHPDSRKAELRDALACAGVRRVVSLGRAGGRPPGLSHDGFHPLQRLTRWVNDERIGLRSAVGTRAPDGLVGHGQANSHSSVTTDTLDSLRTDSRRLSLAEQFETRHGGMGGGRPCDR
ncbi:acyl-CoA reductase [Streptomyces mirabilis]|uniref:acyl-CoA reductase n=1 Tax=Streptomyces mirabilis TaxID=68239 RepID=UPI0033213CD2